jgi:hypothetical protein
MIGVPEFAAAQMAAFLAPTPRHGHGSPQGQSSPRPVVAGARHPQDTTARPLNGQPSRRDDIELGLAPASTRVSKTCGARVGTSGARSSAACRVLDAGGER